MKLLKRDIIISSNQYNYKKMDAIFMNSKNSETSEPDLLILNQFK